MTSTTTTAPAVYIDHVTILLSEEEFSSPPNWLTDNFTILDGGDHTGNSPLLMYRL
jgi:hypothetical protein